MGDHPGLPPPDERAREEAAEAAGVDAEDLTTVESSSDRTELE